MAQVPVYGPMFRGNINWTPWVIKRYRQCGIKGDVRCIWGFPGKLKDSMGVGMVKIHWRYV